MDRFDRYYTLHSMLRGARRPVAGKVLQEKLQCSRATLARVIQYMCAYLHAPIEYDRGANGYCYAKNGEHPYELPGLWFNASELYALRAAHELLTTTQPGLLGHHLAPLRQRIEEILDKQQLGNGELLRRVRILNIAARAGADCFQQIAGAVMQRKRLRITYHARGGDEITDRIVSPQRLVHYRGNWHLDAWCHLRKHLRNFSVDRIKTCIVQDMPAKEIDDSALDKYFTTAYGIFAGEPTDIAILRFTARAARWVADEHWHPEQQGEWLPDGRYELRLPYGDPRELIMDILKHGPEVEVVEPELLRHEVMERLQRMMQVYARDGARAVMSSHE